jgi:hypothetical protein
VSTGGKTSKGFDSTMKPHLHFYGSTRWMKLGLTLAFCSVASLPVFACTIFVLTGTSRVLFCNNEDWSNPKTRIWFIPASDRYYGCVYVGCVPSEVIRQ